MTIVTIMTRCAMQLHWLVKDGIGWIVPVFVPDKTKRRREWREEDGGNERCWTGKKLQGPGRNRRREDGQREMRDRGICFVLTE